MASAGNNTIEGVDIVERHILRARCHIKAAGMEGQVSVRTSDYHRLRDTEDASFDAMYAVESLVHSVEPMKALEEFYRLLKPGGRICLIRMKFPPRAASCCSDVCIRGQIR